VSIADYGEENIYGMFLSEPARKGHVRKFRKGFNTTHKTKISACAKFKQLLESGQLKIKSKPLISELKAFVAHGTTFGAKTGEHDDLVMSTMLNVRMQKILAEWDPAIYEKMRDADSESSVMPMPVFISF
jgi:replication fork clamp-binding protein CrfC